ncbi:MAG: hypothetical protein IKZ95_00910 [Lachnospiraceae bacterium]|nr:hypothetical protein [Lachnospiraceae bacterium]
MKEKAKERFRKIKAVIGKGYSKFNTFFSEKNNLYTTLVVVFLPIALTLAVEMISRASFLAGFAFLFQHPVAFLSMRCSLPARC